MNLNELNQKYTVVENIAINVINEMPIEQVWDALRELRVIRERNAIKRNVRPGSILHALELRSKAHMDAGQG